MKVLLIDNYDSFTWNLAQILAQSSLCEFDIVKNDDHFLEKINDYDKILISPGSGLPKDAGCILNVIKEFAERKSILGVCLGHQAIGVAFGSQLKQLEKIYHGEVTQISLTISDSLFRGLSDVFIGGRYHSWVIDKYQLPECIEIIAEDELGEIMAIRHKTMDIKGIQFHPESILTPEGEKIIRNWLLI